MPPEILWIAAGVGTIIIFILFYIASTREARFKNIIFAALIAILYFLYAMMICLHYEAFFDALHGACQPH